MAHTIALSDEDYAVLEAAAERTGETIEQLVRQAIAKQLTAPTKPKQKGHYRLPTGEPISPEEDAEMERLAQQIGDAHPWASEIVIEDRGPR